MSHPVHALPDQNEHEILIPLSSYPDSQRNDSSRRVRRRDTLCKGSRPQAMLTKTRERPTTAHRASVFEL
eukprot:2926820-Pyramimonas_sp.AAC.1